MKVVVSVDRFLNIAYPKRFTLAFKPRVQLSIIIGIVSFNYIYYSFITWNSVYLSVNSTGTEVFLCKRKYDPAVLRWMDLFNSTIIPFLCMILMSSAVITAVRRSRSRMYEKKSSNDDKTKPSLSRTAVRDRKFAITTVTLNLMFLTLYLPIVIDNLVTLSSDPVIANLIHYFFDMLHYCYHASGFYVQMAVNSVFRNQFLAIFNGIIRRTPRSSIH